MESGDSGLADQDLGSVLLKSFRSAVGDRDGPRAIALFNFCILAARQGETSAAAACVVMHDHFLRPEGQCE